MAVPLTAPDGAPAMFMGRVWDADGWDPASREPRATTCPATPARDGTPAVRLTAIGFVGAAFSGYYPDCRSVFGFWDTFADDRALHDAINRDNPITLPRLLQRHRLAARHGRRPARPVRAASPRLRALRRALPGREGQGDADARGRLPAPGLRALGLGVQPRGGSCTRADDGTLTSLTRARGDGVRRRHPGRRLGRADPLDADPVPRRARRGGALERPGRRSIGNTTVEAVSALVKSHLSPPGGNDAPPSFEVLLDALQLGLLRDLEAKATRSSCSSRRARGRVLRGRRWAHVDGPGRGTEGAGTASAAAHAPAHAGRAARRPEHRPARLRPGARASRRDAQPAVHGLDHLRQAARGRSPDQPVVDTSSLSGFLATASGGELNAVIDQGSTPGCSITRSTRTTAASTA